MDHPVQSVQSFHKHQEEELVQNQQDQVLQSASQDKEVALELSLPAWAVTLHPAEHSEAGEDPVEDPG